MMMMAEEDKEEGDEGDEEGENPPQPIPPPGWLALPSWEGSPFGEDSHSSCAENVERGLFVFCPWYMLCSKVQERRNVITDFLWRGSKL